MKTTALGLALVTASLALGSTSALAWHVHHHHRLHHRVFADRYYARHEAPYAGYGPYGSPSPSEEPFGSGRYNPYAGYSGPGSEVLNATERARREPGVTLELAPDAKETATGGPSGGVPGFGGH